MCMRFTARCKTLCQMKHNADIGYVLKMRRAIIICSFIFVVARVRAVFLIYDPTLTTLIKLNNRREEI